MYLYIPNQTLIPHVFCCGRNTNNNKLKHKLMWIRHNRFLKGEEIERLRRRLEIGLHCVSNFKLN